MSKIDDLEKRNEPLPRPKPKTHSAWSQKPESEAARRHRIYGPSDPVERAEWLIEKAEAMERDANSMEGTCWVGDMSPSSAKRLEAAQLREQAALLLREARRKRPSPCGGGE